MIRKTQRNDCGRSRNQILFGSISALALSAVLAAPAHALPARDDVGPDGIVDTDNEWAGVGQMFNLVGGGSVGLCTGTLINPRTVIFAAHCVDDTADEGYGALTGGQPISFGFNVENNFPGDLIQWINDGFTSQPDINLYNVLQVQTVFNAPPGNFPQGDVAIASFDAHIADLPTYGMLFSPLDGPTHAALAGYGATGTGSAGPNLGIDFKRRAGENMIDGLYSQNDFVAGVFNVPGASFGDPSAEQLLYHIDFDRPDRNPGDCARGEFFGLGFGNDIVCNTPPFGASQPLTWDGTSAILTGDHIDWYPGDALPNEVGTAGGDSGSALFADQIFSRPLITGVLSGGWQVGFFSPNGGYGDVSYYNPLFLFRDWIQANNPYVYASAKHGNGRWSDPDHWKQGLDPNYFIIDKHGNVKNGVPGDPEPGSMADEPKWGTVFDLDIPDDVEGETGAGGAAMAAPTSGIVADNASATVEAPDGFNFGPWGGSHNTSPSASDDGPTGPGSTGFVPNNDWGTFGAWSGPTDGVARFYDVTLDNVGTTWVDMNVEIDRLSVKGHLTGLDVKSSYQLNSLIAVEQHRGFVNVDGLLDTREYMLWGGILTGDGAINAETLYNVKGVVSAGDFLGVGALTLNGDYVQTSHGGMLINIKRRWGHVSNDFIQVNGAASLDGDAIVAPVDLFSTPRWGDVYTVMNADTVVGDFDDVHLLLASPILFGDSVIQTNGDVDIVVDAHRLGHLYGEGHAYHSLGEALDEFRWGGQYDTFSDVFSLVDSASFESLNTVLFGLTPHDAFMQANMVFGFNSTFTSHLAARGSELRAGVRGVSFAGMRSAFASADRAGQPANPMALTRDVSSGPAAKSRRLGVFVSSRNFYNHSAGALHPGASVENQAFNALDSGADYNPFTDSGETYGDLALGVDYRLADDLAVGVAFSTSKLDLSSNTNGPVSNDNAGLAVYATKYGRNWYVDGYYGLSHHDFELERTTSALFDAQNQGDWATALSAPEAKQAIVGLRTGWTFEPVAGLTVGPQATSTYSNTRFGAYREVAAGDFNLLVDERNLTSFEVTAGTSFQYSHITDSGKLFSAFGEISAARELGDSREIVTAAFALAPENRFAVERLLDEEWYTASAGLTYAVRSNLLTQVQVGADFNRGPLSQHFATFKLDWRF